MKRTALQFSVLGILLSCLAPEGLAQSIRPGTEIRVRLLDNLDTGEAKAGQVFSAILAEPVSVGNKGLLGRGVRVTGHVREAVSSGRLEQPASITLVLTTIGKTPIQTRTLRIDSKSHVVRIAAVIGGGSTGGGIAGGGKGAPIGTAVGTGSEMETAYVTRKHEIVLPSETELDFVISDRPSTVVKTPEPGVERTIDHASEAGPAIWHDDSREENDDAYDALIFSDLDKWSIRSYFQSNYGNLPPGLAKRGGGLSPGLEKHVHRDETLPASLQNRVESLPAELEHKLPRLPPGYSRVVLSGRVLILARDGQIVDLMFIYQ